jgi:SpoVK/Ycf46/Vps4 family AAA+-type ATPase
MVDRVPARRWLQNYELCDKMQNPPILLFNEADQLLNKRSADTGQGTDKAWNALQNIFLEALEQPKGIIIATTNLISCMDTAYSRRFDIILEFPPPGEAERHSIWKVRRPGKLPGLATLDISRLAHYDLTGGQITKVIRNACLHLASGVSKSKKITTELLVSFCEQEKKQSFETRQNKPATIGFS